MYRLTALVALVVLAGTACADDDLDFFEKKIRPVLAESCYSCHSANSKKVKGGLKLDRREDILKGGETGPALVPGSPEKSRIIEAVHFTNPDLQMPPKGKLADAAIADLTTWIKNGAKWPATPNAPSAKAAEGFDLEKRKREHWSWQPIRAAELPAGSASAIDRFVDVKLKEKGLTPAPPAEARVLLRRLSFDIVGLPPTPEMVKDFEKAFAVDRTRAVGAVVDQLLASHQFGERWGRHWLDLMRYGESRGHELDFTLPNAYQYRDYVIRALNADVPYDQFTREHLAGDLLPKPRLHPQEGYNESTLGTGFWFLGEQVHSPVDICQDRADRLDNQLDVMTKTFLGLTVACARCHDHKFDAISTKDYYALAGFLESSSYRLVAFDTHEHNRPIAAAIWRLREIYRPKFNDAIVAAFEPGLKSLDDYLEEARAALRKAPSTVPTARRADLDPRRVELWAQHLRAAVKDRRDPLHVYAVELSGQKFEPLKTESPHPQTQVIVDYQTCSPDAWLPDGVAYGPGPVQPGMIRLPDGVLATEASAEFDPLWSNLKTTRGDSESSGIAKAMRPGRMIRTPKFDIDGKIYLRLRGAGQIYAAVEGHVVVVGPLHNGLISSFNVGPEFRWHTLDLSQYKGRRVHLEITPAANECAVAKVIQSPTSPPADDPLAARPEVADWDGVLTPVPLPEHAGRLRSRFTSAVAALKQGAAAPRDAHRINWLLAHPEMFGVAAPLADLQKAYAGEQAKLAAAIRLDSRLAPAMLDGNGVNERVFIRGNHKTPGDIAPRRLLAALVGSDEIAADHGSGRLELAKQITDPAVNPFFTRVFVNRVWHHMFGRGIVGSVDNFGVLGEAPTHPELLDHLAAQFAQDGYSLKRLIRQIALTDVYQRSSRPSADAVKIDPGNILLQHARVRRLEGEAIRDAILSVSGRLDATSFGPSIPVFLTDFQQGRGRPDSGPLDGAGRRSIYLASRRNFLSSFLQAFDTPTPFSTVGRRSVSNVPAQALILLNDPFVHQQAELWAKRTLAEPGDLAQRVQRMYRTAYGRGPTDTEMSACRDFLGDANDAAAWTALAHVLINGKEFTFIE
ncbi:MAG: PSD1 and planctomycete cytochrome C domain-containing protein [Planctomycetota bacterium]